MGSSPIAILVLDTFSAILGYLDVLYVRVRSGTAAIADRRCP
jgi:hypothetical protein